MAESSINAYASVIIAAAILIRTCIELRQRRLGKIPKPIVSLKPKKKDYTRQEQLGFLKGLAFGIFVTLLAHLDLILGSFNYVPLGWMVFLIQVPFLWGYFCITFFFVVLTKFFIVTNLGNYTDNWRGITDGMLMAIASLQIILFLIYPEFFVRIVNCCDWS